ncbi:hypothetical protein ACFLWL_03995 [Chloroflexota bacterium]
MVDLKKQDYRNVEENQIAYLSTFPPRSCGIATFTYDLTQAMDSLFDPVIESKIVAMNAPIIANATPTTAKAIIIMINPNILMPVTCLHKE